jgi:small-conductance mechanosensitive channel
MTFNKNLYRRIFLLTGILIIIELIYLGIKAEVISIDPVIIRVVELILTLLLTLLVSTVILRLTGNKVWTMFEKEMELEQRIIISKLYSISLYSIALLITFWKAGVSLGNLTLFIGLIATGFAFAIRDLLLSFFAWFIILNKKPFHMGDYIRIGEDFGLVTRIGTFFFTLELSSADEFLKVPNSLVLNRTIYNKGSGKFREDIRLYLESVPDDISEKLNELATFIRTRTSIKEPVKAQLIADNQGWFIFLSYPTNFKQDQLKPAIIIETYRLFGGVLKISG